MTSPFLTFPYISKRDLQLPVNQFGGLYDIKVSFGAQGNNVADDTAAVQAAVDSGLPLLIPRGKYKLTSSITWDPMTRTLIMIGLNGDEDVDINASMFVDGRAGTPDEPLFHRVGRWIEQDNTPHKEDETPVDMSAGRGVILKSISFYGNHQNQYSSAFEIQGCQSSYIEDCTFHGGRGLTLGQANFDTVVINCRFRGNFDVNYETTRLSDSATAEAQARLRWGLYAGGHKTIINATCITCGTGLYLTGPCSNLIGARVEVCGYAGIFGETEVNIDGVNNFGITRSSISGVSMEACRRGILIHSASSSTFSALHYWGTAEHHYGEYGFQLNSGVTANCRIENIVAQGRADFGYIRNFSHVPTWNSSGAAGAMANPLGYYGGADECYHYLNTAIFEAASSNGSITAFYDLMHRGLTGLNIRDVDSTLKHPVFCKNFGGTVNPTSSATTAAVAFPDRISASSVRFATGGLTVENDGTSTLAADTYYYASTLRAKHAETGIDYSRDDGDNDGQRSVVVSSTGKKVVIVWSGTSYDGIRRIYRGTEKGCFDGYWELTNADGSFEDNGTTEFTSVGSPPSFADIPSLQETDANFYVVATPSWSTIVWVTDKATTGFTLNFGTAAPDGNQTVAWMMFRP